VREGRGEWGGCERVVHGEGVRQGCVRERCVGRV
jgi:hypothetical protein